MDHGLSEQLMRQLSERVAEQMGLNFPRERWRELAAGINSAARELRIVDPTAWVRSLQSGPLTKEQIEVLAGELTIGETYFLREQRGFAIVGEHILPELIRARRQSGRRLRIWSAGCCTGEEPYSIAILLDRILPDLREWQVTILATDVNPRFLHRAAEGTYGEWSFRDAPPWLKENYFQPLAGNRYAIVPRIKERVRFAFLNLGEGGYPSLANDTNAMDLIFCRNVLMYFTPEMAARVVHNFYRSLMEGGWLLVGAVETSARLFSQFVAVPFEAATCYQKKEPPLPMSLVDEQSAASLPLPPTSDPVVAQPAPAVEPRDSPAERTQEELQASRNEVAPYQEALALFERGKYVEAAGKLRISDAAACTADSLVLMAKIHANLGELAEARRWADRAVAADKINSASHYLLAMILQEQDAPDEAQISLKRALYLAPDFILGHFALGNLERRQGKRKEAHRHFTNAIALLRACGDSEELPCSDGMPARRLKEMIESIMLADFAA